MLVKKLKENITKQEAEKIAKEFIKSIPDIKKSERFEIIIDQPEITDYLICEQGTLRTCTDEEWLEYFNKKHPKPEYKEKKIYYGEGYYKRKKKNITNW